jgi:hypothetical protein
MLAELLEHFVQEKLCELVTSPSQLGSTNASGMLESASGMEHELDFDDENDVGADMILPGRGELEDIPKVSRRFDRY